MRLDWSWNILGVGTVVLLSHLHAESVVQVSVHKPSAQAKKYSLISTTEQEDRVAS